MLSCHVFEFQVKVQRRKLSLKGTLKKQVEE